MSRPQNFGEHGRELISSEIALRLLRLLCSGEAERGAFVDGFGLRRDHVQALLQRTVFKVRWGSCLRVAWFGKQGCWQLLSAGQPAAAAPLLCGCWMWIMQALCCCAAHQQTQVLCGESQPLLNTLPWQLNFAGALVCAALQYTLLPCYLPCADRSDGEHRGAGPVLKQGSCSIRAVSSPFPSLQIVPMENIRGRARVEAGELCLRKNGRGVDPNRNWDYHWGEKEKGEPHLQRQHCCVHSVHVPAGAVLIVFMLLASFSWLCRLRPQ